MTIQYLAGLVDGEGHICVVNNKNGRGELHRRALIRVVQSEFNQGEQLFDIIKNKWGGTVCYKRKYAMYEWSIYGKNAVDLARQLKPLLIVKAYQVDRLLAEDSQINGRVTSSTQ